MQICKSAHKISMSTLLIVNQIGKEKKNPSSLNPCILSTTPCELIDSLTVKLANTFTVIPLHQLWSRKTCSITSVISGLSV